MIRDTFGARSDGTWGWAAEEADVDDHAPASTWPLGVAGPLMDRGCAGDRHQFPLSARAATMRTYPIRPRSRGPTSTVLMSVPLVVRP